MTVRNDGGYNRSGFTERSNILFSQDGTRIFVADPSRDHVAVFNASDATVFRFLNVGIAPNIMSLLPDGRSAAVLCSGRQTGDSESVYILDTFNSVVSDFGLFAGQNAEAFNNVQFARDGIFCLFPDTTTTGSPCLIYAAGAWGADRATAGDPARS
jgi:DNA-binding beta-propeller fold protein YncE